MNRIQRARRFRLATLVLTLGAVLAVSSLPAASPTYAAGNASVRITPAPVAAAGPGASFTVSVVSNADVPASGVQATVTFDKTVLQIVDIGRPAADWGAAEFFVGPTGDLTVAANEAALVASANGTGVLPTVAASFTPPGTVTAGVDHTFLLITFQVIGCPAGTTTIGLPAYAATPASAGNALVLDDTGSPATTTSTGATVDACANNTGNPRTRVTSSLEAGFLALEVAPAFTIPLLRQVTNAVEVPVRVYSDGIWTLKVEDAMPPGKAAADRGHMVDGIPTTKRLTQPMTAQYDGEPVRSLDVDPIGALTAGSGTAQPVITLRQAVGPTDPPAAYSITLIFTATSGF